MQHKFSLIAPQQPKDEMINIIMPRTIKLTQISLPSLPSSFSANALKITMTIPKTCKRSICGEKVLEYSTVNV